MCALQLSICSTRSVLLSNSTLHFANMDEVLAAEAKELWRPSSPEKTQIHDFMTKINWKYGLSLNNYNDLWQWSVTEPAKFWEETWHYTAIKAHEPYKQVRALKVHE